MNFDVRIAGVNITFNGELDENFINRLTPYKSKFSFPDITVNYELCDSIQLPKEKEILKVENDRTWFHYENFFCFSDYNVQIDKTVLYTRISPNVINISVYSFNNQDEIEILNSVLREYKRNLPNIKDREIADQVKVDKNCLLLNSTDHALRYGMLHHKAFSLHSSAIAYKNSGIVFSAPSGTGKSTHTALWKKYYDAQLVNDDSPFISISDDIVMLNGSPWAGTTGLNTNISVPLKAIVFLEQAKENSITKLMSLRALQFLLRELLKPCDRQLTDNIYTLLNLVLASVPCYLLRCTPDKKAADVVYNELFN